MEEPEPRAVRPWSKAGAAARLGGVAAAYFGLAQLGLLFSLPGSLASPIWPPAGLALAAAVLWGPRVLPAVLAGAFAAEWAGSGAPAAALALAAGNTAEAALGAWLVRRAGGLRSFDALGGVLRFAAAALLAPLPAATAGAAVLALLDGAPAAETWRTWYLGDAAGILVVAPVFLLAARARPARWPAARVAEATAIGAALLAAASFVFGLLPGVPAAPPGLVVLLMPPLVWAAYRLGPATAALAVLYLDALAVAVTRGGGGPFQASTPNDSLLVLQTFVFSVGLMALGLAALAAERRRAAAGLESRVAERTARLEEVNALLRREVDERRRAQDQVADAQHIAGLGSWEWEVAQDRVRWSEELHRIFGRGPAGFQASYRGYLDAVHPDDRARVAAAVQAAVRSPGPFQFDHRIVRPDGTVRHLHCEGRVDTDAAGAAARLVGVAQDVTERLADQRALAESLERFRALADASPIGIVHTRADGTVDYVNDKWRQITGVADHTDRERMRLSVHPEDQPAMAQLWRACVAEGREFAADMRFVHPDGAVRWTRARAVPVRDASGAITGFVSALADITDQRAAEAKDREVRRLREQAEFKTNFLRTAAHELGTPLTPIAIQAHILSTLLREGGTEDQRKAMEILDRNLGRLQVLVQDMLESARLQSGRLRLNVRPMDLAHVVHDVVETFQGPAIQTGVVLDTAGPHEMPVVADPDRLSQVLYNLLSNAMKFTPPGGQIHVRLAAPAPDRVRVTVQDTGAGFTPEQGALLFQPFSQLHDPDRPRRGGSGLGLYISRGIVEQHGGRLTASSPGPGQGATFSFELPSVAVAMPSFGAEPEAEAQGRPSQPQAAP